MIRGGGVKSGIGLDTLCWKTLSPHIFDINIRCTYLLSFSDHVRNVQHPGYVRGHPSRTLLVRFRSDDWYSFGLRWRRVPHRAHLRRLRPTTRHTPSGLGRPRSHRLPDEDPHRKGLQLHDYRWTRNCSRHQGEAVLRGTRLRAGNADGRVVQRSGEILRTSRRTGESWV